MPDGKVALDLYEFINAYELTQTSKCAVTDFSEIADEVGEENEKEECYTFVKDNVLSKL